MMTSSNGNIFRVTGPLCGEFTGHRRIPHTKASDADLCDVFFDLRPNNGWVNDREAGDLRRHRGHYDVTVMCFWTTVLMSLRVKNNSVTLSAFVTDRLMVINGLDKGLLHVRRQIITWTNELLSSWSDEI